MFEHCIVHQAGVTDATKKTTYVWKKNKQKTELPRIAANEA